jgi:hypothetical protein
VTPEVLVVLVQGAVRTPFKWQGYPDIPRASLPFRPAWLLRTMVSRCPRTVGDGAKRAAPA